MTGRPLPVPDAASAPYWASCAEHILTLPRCSRCQTLAYPPDISCPHCHTFEPDFKFERVTGQGKVRTWTVMRHAFLAGFEVPYMLVDVQLDDQPEVRLIGRLLDGPDTPLRIGDAMTLAFEDLAPGVSVPAFRKAAQS